jgi:hypothetical protein
MPYAALGRLGDEAMKATGCESFGLRVGANTKASSLGLTSLVSLNSATVREAIRVVTDTLKTSETGGAAFLRVRERLASFGYAVMALNIEAVDQIEDAAVAIGCNIVRQLCGRKWRPLSVRLAREPPRDKTPFVRFFQAPVDFAQPSSCIVFEAVLLDQPVRGRKADYADVLAPILEEAAQSVPSDFLSAVKLVIRTQVGAGALSRDSVCRALDLNARTLAYRLESYGVSYSSLVGEARFDAAQSLLRRARPIAEIAACSASRSRAHSSAPSGPGRGRRQAVGGRGRAQGAAVLGPDAPCRHEVNEAGS